ncbi:hypothetical protein [Kitasatospora paracochleata]|uniref:PepSY domain-containing protein n=1 Tax=Kitasatospora paracochleata TaxID=58354 RepID=A0ABT1J333_9ACTN|nr:hypothetical protein [Kitasatospora paracochleata]MCP2311778.1 hypothetical protein [Kitasatospora paracochleata]
MSEPMGTVEPQGQPGGDRTRDGRAGRWLSSRSARWVAAGAVVVVIGGGAAAAVIHHAGEGHESGGRFAGTARGGERHDRDGQGGTRAATAGRHAPAPLPSLDAADAVVKASSAVPGGKVESLSAVTEQGGGRAWRAVVLGPDGVRHAVVVDGASDTITANTVLGG